MLGGRYSTRLDVLSDDELAHPLRNEEADDRLQGRAAGLRASSGGGYDR